MARLWTEGFESGDLLCMSFNGVTGVACDNGSYRTGNYSLRIIANSSYNCYKNLTLGSEFYVRVGFMNNGIGSSGQSPIVWRNGTTELGSVRISGTGNVAIYTSTGTLVATGLTSLQPNTWYLLEAHIKIADANGVIEVRLDGTDEISFTGDTKPGTATTATSIYFRGGYNYSWWDDVAVNDISGGADNSWCGDGHIIALVPDAAGDVTQLTPSAGSNYANVDDRPADGDTTYNESAVTDQYDLYNLPACGLSSVNISRVWVEARARETVAINGTCRLGLKTLGSEYWSSDLSLTATYTLQLLGPIYTANPGGGAWSTAHLDALQLGFKARG